MKPIAPPSLFKSSTVAALSLAAGLALAAGAQAQSAPPQQGEQAQHRWAEGADRQTMQAEHARRLQALRAVLAIRPDQESAFQAFASAMRPEGGAWGPGRTGENEHRPMGQDQDSDMSAPQRAEMMVREFDEHSREVGQHLERVAAATQALYAVLSPEQQRAFDALPTLMGHEGWGGHRMERMHGGEGGMGYEPDGRADRAPGEDAPR